MKTWSLADVMDVLKHVERITRPPRRPNHDADERRGGCPNGGECPPDCSRTSFGCVNGAEQLAEREAETECLVPEDFNAVCRCVACLAEEQASAVEYDNDPMVSDSFLRYHEVPNPTEPGLTDDDVWCTWCGRSAAECDSEPCPKRDTTSAPVKSTPGTGAEPNSPAAPSTAGDSSPAVSDIPPSPAGEPPDLATWLEPAVLTALDREMPYADVRYSNDGDGSYRKFPDAQAWQEHVAPLIAAQIAQALPDYPAGPPRHSFVAGYLAAVDLIENKAQADRDLADMLPEDHAVDPACLRKSTEWGQELARYMRAIAPK